MIVLPIGAFIVKQDEAKKSLIERTDSKKPNTGIIVFTSVELNKYQLATVVFRENYGEKIIIDEQEYLFFRDFNSSIFYILADD